MNQVATFDPAKLKERISDIVKGTFLDLIPPEAFKTMVDTEIKAFFETPSISYKVVEEKDSYGRNYNHGLRLERVEQMTPFQEMVRLEIVKKVKGDLANELSDEKWGSHYKDDGRKGEMVKTILRELAPEMVTALFTNITFDVMNKIRQGVH